MGWGGAGRGGQFNRHVLEAEQAAYVREGIPWAHVPYRDLQPCLDVIEARGAGLLCLLDGGAPACAPAAGPGGPGGPGVIGGVPARRSFGGWL